MVIGAPYPNPQGENLILYSSAFQLPSVHRMVFTAFQRISSQ